LDQRAGHVSGFAGVFLTLRQRPWPLAARAAIEVKEIIYGDNGKKLKETEEVRKRLPPDKTAATFWLKSRQPLSRLSGCSGACAAGAQPRRGKRVCAVAEHGLRNAENEEVEGVLPATVRGGKEPAVS
jgi:hypothetical protein